MLCFAFSVASIDRASNPPALLADTFERRSEYRKHEYSNHDSACIALHIASCTYMPGHGKAASLPLRRQRGDIDFLALHPPPERRSQRRAGRCDMPTRRVDGLERHDLLEDASRPRVLLALGEALSEGSCPAAQERAGRRRLLVAHLLEVRDSTSTRKRRGSRLS